MKNIQLSLQGIEALPDYEVEQFAEEALFARNTLLNKTGPGSEFTGWVELPETYDKEEFAAIKKAAKKIRKESKALVVCGIGGSYLGAAAAIDFLKGSMHNLKQAGKEDGDLQIFFAGNNMSPNYINDVLELVKDKDFSVNVISKSGTTMETSVSFRIFKKALEEKYGKEEAAGRIYATTDKKKGALKALADKEGYQTFVVPDDIGGRFSVLSAVGLLPIAAAGCDIDKLMAGAASVREELLSGEDEYTEAMAYAALRQQLYEWDRFIEIFVNYDPDLRMFAEWLKQLFGESEGKEGYGIFPASLNFTSDLHSMGQMIQEGERNIFETKWNYCNNKISVMDNKFESSFGKYQNNKNKKINYE